MINLCQPVDDLELLFIISALEAIEIPYLVVGQHFGSLFPGVQIGSYNQRTVRVPAFYVDTARQLIREVRADYISPSRNLALRSKLRIVLETLLFGWFIPGGKKKNR